MNKIEREQLKKYCDEKDIKYASITARVKNMMKKDSNLTEEEAVKIAIENYKKVNYKYMVYDVPLKKICEQENLNERNIIYKYIKDYKDRDDITMDDALNEIIEFYKNPPIANTKYFYKNRPVKEVCEEKGINCGSVLDMYRRKYRDRDDMTMDEAFDEIFKYLDEKKNELSKYMYKGRSVKEVCEDKGLNSESVITRYRKKYKDRNDITMDEAFDEIINYFVSSRKTEKILYKGKSVKKICEENNFNYNKVVKRYKDEYKYRTDITMDDAFEEIFKYYKENTEKIGKYFYKDVSVSKICEENNLNYGRVISMYKRKYENNKDVSMDEAFDEIFRYYMDPNAKEKFLYKGRPVKEICKEKNLDYERVLERRRRNYQNRDDLTMDEIFEEIFKYYENPNAREKYLYKNVPVRKICEQKGIRYRTVTDKYRKEYSNRDDITMDDAFDEIFEYYEKVKFISYCNENDLDYKYIMEKYEKEYKNKKDLSMADAFREIIENDSNSKIVYYFENKPIEEYCLQEGLDYEEVIKIYKMKKARNKRKSVTMVEAVFEVINNTTPEEKEKRKLIEKRKQINKVFDLLENEDIVDDNVREEICEKLNIDFMSVSNLIGLNFEFRKAVNLIWYFSDTMEGNKKSITYPKVIEILLLNNELGTKNKEDIQKIKTYDLIGLYKSRLSECREMIFLKENDYFNKVFESISDKYQINKKNRNTFINEIKKIYINVLDSTRINEEEKLFEYLDLNVKDEFIDYLKDSNIKEKENTKVKRKVKYKINGVSLKEICKDKGINYGSVVAKYKREYENREDLTEEEKLQEAVDSLKNKKDKKKVIDNVESKNSLLKEEPKQEVDSLKEKQDKKKVIDNVESKNSLLEKISKQEVDSLKEKQDEKKSIDSVKPKNSLLEKLPKPIELIENNNIEKNKIPFPDALIDKLEYLFRGQYDGKKYEQPNFKSQNIDKEYKVDDYKLIDYCRQNSVNYADVIRAYRENYEGSRFISESDAFKEIVKLLKEGKTIKSDIRLSFGRTNKGIDFDYVGKVYREKYEGREDITKAQAISEIILEIKEGTYYGKRLEEYCKENNYPYSEMSSRIMNLKGRYSKFSNEELLERAKTEYHNNKKIEARNKLKGAKNKLYNQLLFNDNFSDYKFIEIYDFLSIDYDTVEKLKNIGFSDVEAMSIILCYSDKVNQNQYLTLSNQSIEKLAKFKKESVRPEISDIINSQENTLMQTINDSEYINLETARIICKKLNINFENVYQLSEFYGEKTAINIVWYFSKAKNLSSKPLLLKEVNKINKEVLEMQNKDREEINKMDTYYLISLYKCNLYDSRENIIEKEEEYFNSIIDSLSKKIIINEDVEMILKSELQKLLIDAIDKINVNDSSKMLKSMDLYIKQGITNYLNNPQIREDNKIKVKKL